MGYPWLEYKHYGISLLEYEHYGISLLDNEHYGISLLDLGDGDEGGLVVVHAGTPMYRSSFLQATLGTCFGGTVEVGSLALVVLLMGLGTCETEVIVGDQFEDLR